MTDSSTDLRFSDLGVPENRLRYAETSVGYRCETLLQTSHPCGDQAPSYPSWIVDALPPGIAAAAPAPKRRVYLSRGPGRPRDGKRARCYLTNRCT